MFQAWQVKDKTIMTLVGFSILAATIALSVAPAHAQKKAAAKAAKVKKPWVKICRGDKKKKVCTIRIDEVDPLSLSPYSPILMEYANGKPTILKVTLPHTWPIGVTLTNNKTKKEKKTIQPLDVIWDIQKNAFIQLGEKGKKTVMKFDQCNNFGCIAYVKMSDALLGAMKKAKLIIVAGNSKRLGKPHGMSFPMGDFAKSYDGDELDEKIYAKALNKKVVTMRKKRISFMKKRQQAMLAARKKSKEKKK